MELNTDAFVHRQVGKCEINGFFSVMVGENVGEAGKEGVPWGKEC